MPYPARRLLARLPRLDPVRVDELVGVLLMIEIELQVWLSPYVSERLWSGLGGAALAIGVAVRRRRPFGAAVLAFCAVTTQDALGGRVTHHSVGALLAIFLIFYGTGAFLAERRAWLALAVGVVAIGADALIATEGLSEIVFPVIFLLLGPWALGRMLRERGARERAHRESAERLDSEREQRAATAAYGERARIARELHDVIAHSVSVMVIQAAGARTVMGSNPDQAEASLQSVERAGREALAEMRRLLGVLGGGEGVRLAPQPGLADVQDLIERTCAAGVKTELHVEGEPAMLSPALDLCAFRIVQEGLTNAIKHAGPAHATVRVRWASDALELEVSDDGRGSRVVDDPAGGHSLASGPGVTNGTSATSGHGIAGMRERAVLHGGSIQAGPGPSGGFVVRASLPLAAVGVPLTAEGVR